MQAKKSLGQNFLKSKSVISKMIEAGTVSEHDTVLEIGPGKGVLTAGLLEKGAHVIAVEKDDRMIPILEERFEKEMASGQLHIFHTDILKVSLPDILIDDHMPYKLIANIPYYITGEIIRTFLSHNHQPTDMVLMVQKEVAKRIVVSDNKESILSISVKAYGIPKYITTVSKKLFSPAPKVDSAVLHIHSITKENFHTISEEQFFTVVKTGFAHKRKTLHNNLKKIITEEKFHSCSINPQVRSENLELKDWICLANPIDQ